MGLLDDLTPEHRKYSCKIRTVCETLNDEDSTILNSAAMNPEWSVGGLVAALNKKGISLSPSVITKHRAKACSCWKI
jgi:hypothetical protein